MNPTRFKILLGVAAVLLAVLLWNWISGWGLVTVHVEGQPLTKVLRSIEGQGGIKIVTNADLTTPVSMDVDRVPVAEAVDVVAARLDANWMVSYAAGPSKADVAAGISSLQAGGRDENFARFGFRGGSGGGDFEGMGPADSAVDARRLSWKVSPSDAPQLQSYLSQISQKTGVAVIVPQTWNPPLATAPGGGPAAKALKAMVSSAKGQLQEIFYLRVQADDRNRVADNGPGGARPARGPSDGGFGGPGGPGGPGGGRPDFNPDWMAERLQARIEQLPKPEQEQAKKDFDEMRDFWTKMRALPEDQRRAAMEKMFSSPAFQERMSERQAQRDEKSGPERRADRARNYIQRKQAIKDSAAQGS